MAKNKYWKQAPLPFTGLTDFIAWMEQYYGINMLKSNSKLLDKTSSIAKNSKLNDQCLISYNKAVKNNEQEPE